jgi:hypothetical protein
MPEQRGNAAAARPVAGPLRILHVEDNPDDVELVRATLAAGGVSCETVIVSGREEFTRALESGRFDLILSDFSLPQFDGLAALEIARRIAPAVPFILVSGTLGEESAVESLRGGATDYVLKQRLARLAAAVQRAMEEAGERRARREAEEALRRERHFLGALVENLQVGIVACDARGFIRLSNRAARELAGVPDGPVGYESWAGGLGLTRPDGRTAVELEGNPMVRAFRSAPVRNEEYLLRGPGDRLRRVSFSGQPIVDEREGKIGAVLALHDITERRELEDQLRQAQKLEAVGRLAGGIAHDFNNLLNVILGYGELILARMPVDDPVRDRLTEIRKAAERAATLTRQLLTFSRKQVVEPRVLDLNALLRDLEKMVHRLIGEDVEMVLALDPVLGRIRADPGQIEQVVMNLVINARDAMPEGGLLRIETAGAVLKTPPGAAPADLRPGPYVVLRVSDSGTGMTPEVRARIFEPFFTTKEEGKGTGLGLATVYGIVRQSGGRIQVESEPGRGTCFTLLFPRVDAPIAGAARDDRGAAPRGSETVLVVEDDERLRKMVEEALSAFGYTILAARDLGQALAISGAHAGTIDLLLTDLVLPGGNGPEVAQRLRERRPGLKVLCMTGYTDDAVPRVGLLQPGTPILRKPFPITTLARKVREVLDGPDGVSDRPGGAP